MRIQKWFLACLITLLLVPLSAFAVIAPPTQEPWLSAHFGMALTKLGIATPQSGEGEDELLLTAYHPDHFRGQFVVAQLSSARSAKIKSTWVDGFMNYERNNTTSVRQVAHKTRRISTAQANQMMDSVLEASNPSTKTREPICIHGPLYLFVLRRNGVVTHGRLEYCDRPETDRLVCEIVNGRACRPEQPVQVAKPTFWHWSR